MNFQALDTLLKLRKEREKLDEKIEEQENHVLAEMVNYYKDTDEQTVTRNGGIVTLCTYSPSVTIVDEDKFVEQCDDKMPWLLDYDPRPISGAVKQLPIKTVRKDGFVILEDGSWAKGVKEIPPARDYNLRVQLVD